MKSILIYEQTIVGEKYREVVIDDRAHIDFVLKNLGDKKVVHIEHDIFSIHIH